MPPGQLRQTPIDRDLKFSDIRQGGTGIADGSASSGLAHQLRAGRDRLKPRFAPVLCEQCSAFGLRNTETRLGRCRIGSY